MTAITVTGATGQFGGQAVRYLLDMGIPAAQIAVVARDTGKAAKFAELGIEVRQGDYDDPASLVEAFKETDKLLFVSASSMDNTLRVRQHAAVTEAARNAGVGHIVYTGFAFAEQMRIGLENVHLATEYMIRTTGIPFTFLRNPFYMDILVNEGLQRTVEQGELVSAAGDGRMNYATRDDLALAAAKVLADDGERHKNAVYELASPHPISYADFAGILSEVSGKPITYRALPPEKALQALVKAGTPEGLAGFLVHVVDKAIADGQFSCASEDLSALIGDRLTTVRQAAAQTLGRP